MKCSKNLFVDKHCLLYREHEIVVNHQYNQSCLHGISLCSLIRRDDVYKRGRKFISINIVLLYWEHPIVVNHQHNQSFLHGISLCGLISQDEGYKT